jgi:hypothetical protein
MNAKVSLQDWVDVNDLLARYCFFVDEGESDAWADLWTEDGVFAGVTRDPVRGREALKQVPKWAISGGSRHKLVNLIIEYGETKDDIIVRGYNFVTGWLGGPRFGAMAVVRYHLVRKGGEWKIKSNQARMQLPEGYDPNGYPEGFPYPANQPTRFPPLDP